MSLTLSNSLETVEGYLVGFGQGFNVFALKRHHLVHVDTRNLEIRSVFGEVEIEERVGCLFCGGHGLHSINNLQQVWNEALLCAAQIQLQYEGSNRFRQGLFCSAQKLHGFGFIW